MIIAVDFDGTLAFYQKGTYPAIGEDLGGAFWLNALKQLGCEIVLWTCRDGAALQMAREWCEERGLPIDAYNEEAPSIRDHWSGGRKIFANIYVDDNALGAPMTRRPDGCRVFDWETAGPVLVARVRGLLAKDHLTGCGYAAGRECECEKIIEARATRAARRTP